MTMCGIYVCACTYIYVLVCVLVERDKLAGVIDPLKHIFSLSLLSLLLFAVFFLRCVSYYCHCYLCCIQRLLGLELRRVSKAYIWDPSFFPCYCSRGAREHRKWYLLRNLRCCFTMPYYIWIYICINAYVRAWVKLVNNISITIYVHIYWRQTLGLAVGQSCVVLRIVRIITFFTHDFICPIINKK